MTILTDMFGSELLTYAGLKPTSDLLMQKKVIGIYFAASWAAPARVFTPQLAMFYEDLIGANKEIEIIYASQDRDKTEFSELYGQMPWPAIPWEKTGIITSLAIKFQVQSIPVLIFVDTDGVLLTRDGRSMVATGEFAFWSSLQALYTKK